MFIWLSLVFSAVLARLPKNGGHYPQPKSNSGGVQPLLDGGFYPFNFGKGNMGLEADRFFLVNVPEFTNPAITPAVAVIDCYCGGDIFSIWENGAMVSTPGAQPVNATPLCTFYRDTPRECVATFYENLGIYSSTVVLDLTPGLHNFTVRVGASPFGSGTAFFSFYTAAVGQFAQAQCFVEGGLDNCYFDVATTGQ